MIQNEKANRFTQRNPIQDISSVRYTPYSPCCGSYWPYPCWAYTWDWSTMPLVNSPISLLAAVDATPPSGVTVPDMVCSEPSCKNTEGFFKFLLVGTALSYFKLFCSKTDIILAKQIGNPCIMEVFFIFYIVLMQIQLK